MGGTWVVDGANVVGARPDGWWKDRAGAAARLRDRLARYAPADGGPARIVLVLEGAARPGAAAGTEGGLTVVHAPRSGDDEIVRQAEAAPAPVLVVTADRGLRDRVRAVGADVAGPGWLLDRL